MSDFPRLRELFIKEDAREMVASAAALISDLLSLKKELGKNKNDHQAVDRLHTRICKKCTPEQTADVKKTITQYLRGLLSNVRNPISVQYVISQTRYDKNVLMCAVTTLANAASAIKELTESFLINVDQQNILSPEKIAQLRQLATRPIPPSSITNEDAAFVKSNAQFFLSVIEIKGNLKINIAHGKALLDKRLEGTAKLHADRVAEAIERTALFLFVISQVLEKAVQDVRSQSVPEEKK